MTPPPPVDDPGSSSSSPGVIPSQAVLMEHNQEELFERAPCGYVYTSPDGLILSVNQTLLDWTGFARDDLVGVRRFPELLSPGGRIYYDTHFGPMLSLQGNVREIALELIKADHTRIPVLINAVLDLDAEGRPRLVRTAIFDATERRAYEVELLRAKEVAETAERRAVALARTLQDTLIPPNPPGITGLDVGAFYRPVGAGDEVGGDFYDVFQIADDDWVITIGDVAGKGVQAAVVTSLARYTLRAAAVRSHLPSDSLAVLNRVLVAEDVDRFCTAAFLRLRRDGAAWEVDVAVGGHPLPLLRRPGEFPKSVGHPGSLLGVLADPVLSDVHFRIEPGDCLLLFTDGVTEARAGTDFYGDDRLAEMLDRHRHTTASALSAGIVSEVVDYQDGWPRDDIAVVAVQVPSGVQVPSPTA